MNVLVVEPGIAPYEKEINGLHEMQDTVGGLITAIYPFEDLVTVISNDESILLGMEFNRSMPGGYGGNMTKKVDASDAQVTYNIYNAVYSGYTDVMTVEKYLRADVNYDGVVDVEDATAIITAVLQK